MKAGLNDIILPHVSRVSASDHIAEALKTAIVSGQMPAGTPLKQDEVAQRFCVSKIPVREALKRLEAEGLVTFERHRGAVVAALSEAEIIEYVEIRAALEAKAADLAAPKISKESLKLAAQHLDEFIRETDPSRWSKLNWEFHATLYRDATRPILLGELRSLYDRLERYIRALLALNGAETPKTHTEHAAILDAFERRDSQAAAELTRAHVLDAGFSLVNHLNDRRPKGE